MKTKLLTLVMLMTLSAATAFAQALEGVAVMTIDGSRTADVTIRLRGVPGDTVSIGNHEQILIGYDNDNTFTINVGAEKTIEIKAVNASSIRSIDCSANDIDYLHIFGLDALEHLNCSVNQLTSLDVSGLTTLEHLNCGVNQLTSLDVSSLTALIYLSAAENPLTSLNVSGLADLEYLSFRNTQLTSVDLSGLAALETILGWQSQLTSLNLSGCVSLSRLSCYDNQLTSLDLSDCVSLTRIECWNNPLTSMDISGLAALETIQCGSTRLTSLDASGLTALTFLRCDDSPFLTSLDVSGCVALELLYCINNAQLTSVNLSGCVSLLLTRIQNNPLLTSLNFSDLTALTHIHVENNGLTSLNLSGCVSLFRVSAHDQNVVVVVPFNDTTTTSVDIELTGVVHTFANGETFSFPSGAPHGVFSGMVSVVRAADERNRHNVTMVAEEGVSIDKAVGIHTVIEGYDFRFYTTIADEYADYDLTVLVNGREVAPTLYDNMYIIENIDEDKEVAFRLTKKVDHIPTANEHLTATTVSAGVGFITIEASNAAVQIVSIAGEVVYNASAVGATTVNVPQGLYVVVVDGTATKVVVR